MTRALTALGAAGAAALLPLALAAPVSAQEAGAQVRVLHGIPGTPVDVYVDGERALEAVRPGLAYVGEPDWAPHLVDLDFADDLRALRARCGSPAELAREMPREWVDALSLAGTPDAVRAKIAARHEAGAGSVVLTPVGDDRLAQLEQLARAL